MEELFLDIRNFFNQCELDVKLHDFITIRDGFEHDLVFELGGELDNGTKNRVKQATSRALQILRTYFKKDEELYLLTYEWDETGNLSVKTPNYLFDCLNVQRAKQASQLTLPYSENETPEYESGFLGVYKLDSKTIPWKHILEGLSNTDMGFSPTIHQIAFFFGIQSQKFFWMVDDRTCQVSSQDKNHLSDVFYLYQKWVNDYYRRAFLESDELSQSDS